MTVSFSGGSPAPTEAIQELERALGFSLSRQFKAFVAVHDGAEPEDNVFSIPGVGRSDVRMFIPISEIDKSRRNIEFFPMGFYPVAYDSCGNHVILKGGQESPVFFWDHEWVDGSNKVADSFDQFLENLEPYSQDELDSRLSHPDTGKI